MSERIKQIVAAVSAVLGSIGRGIGRGGQALGQGAQRNSMRIAGVVLLGGAAYGLYNHPPMQAIGNGEVGVRVNMLTGGTTELHEGGALVIPGLHRLHRYSLRDQIYHPVESSAANGEAPFQSNEGLSLGIDVNVRYALDPHHIAGMARALPDDIGSEIVKPAVQGVIYKTFTRYTVREIFSTKRQEIQQAIEAELKPKLAADGIVLRTVQIGKVDLPADYRAGMERMLAEELASEKMRFTLELKDKQVKASELDAEAEKVRREKAAEAAGNEQIIAAKAQEEAMKHVLPFKEKQIEQRGLEAEAEKVARIKGAEANAQARRIESAGETDSRQKLADAEVYRLEKVGKASSEQLARDGALISKNPLLIQKTMADKLSDKISVIIAPTPTNGGFIGSALLGATKNAPVANPVPAADTEQADGEPQQ